MEESVQETVIGERRGAVGIVRVNRPERKNAMTADMLAEFVRLLKDMGADKEIRCVIVTGTGDTFLSGVDVGKVTSTVGGMTPPEWREVRDLFHEQFTALYEMRKPTIAAVNGSAVVTGVDVAVSCDIRIASDDSRFKVGFRRVALMPTPGINYLLPHIVGPGKAKMMVFSDNFVPAEEALRIGLVEELVPREGLMDRALELAEQLAAGPTMMLATAKEAMNRAFGLNFEWIRRDIDNAQFTLTRSEDYQEAMQAFAEKREPAYKGR
jgi:2-(1,2-epoxy-1,2-dihydrophenyl)acetyl-CoA isomerase